MRRLTPTILLGHIGVWVAGTAAAILYALSVNWLIAGLGWLAGNVLFGCWLSRTGYYPELDDE